MCDEWKPLPQQCGLCLSIDYDYEISGSTEKALRIYGSLQKFIIFM
jgi:hypothetical protein